MLKAAAALNAIAGFCLLAPAAWTQTTATPDMQKVLERLDRLEDENQQLLEEIRELRSELQASATQQPPNAAPTVAERLDVQESRSAELDQSKVGASQRFPISLTGMLLFNAFANGKYSGTQYPAVASQTAGPATDGASLRQTVIGLKFNGPDLPGGGKASGSFYMDFFAGSPAVNNNLMRIRIATLDLKWGNTTVSVGQDKPLISPREPTSLAQVGISPLTGAGNLWDWDPQVRLEHRFSFGDETGLVAQTAVYQTSEGYAGTLPPQYAGTLERTRPAWQGRVEFFHEGRRGAGENQTWRVEIAPGYSGGTTHVAGTSLESEVASIDWLLRPISWLEFTGEAFLGQDVAGLGSLQGFNIVTDWRGYVDGAIPVHTHGEWGQFALFPASRLSLHLYAGEQYNRLSDLSAGGINRNLVYAANLIYRLAPNVLAEFEASQARTEYVNSMLRLNNHYDLALAYLF